MIKAKDLYEELKTSLEREGISDFEYDAQILFEETLKLNPREILKNDAEVSSEDEKKLRKYFSRRAEGEPLQYILGYWEFSGRKYFVGKGVLIPRDDTEVVLRACLPYLKKWQDEDMKIADLCSGSGILAITLKCEFKSAEVTAVEISEDALPYLRKNAEHNNAQIEIVGESLFDCSRRFQNESLRLLISNPPYIKKEELNSLQKEVLHEPVLALDGGVDGCDFYRGILSLYTEKIKTGGMLAFELDAEEALEVRSLMEEKGFGSIEIHKDLGGINRAITGIKLK